MRLGWVGVLGPESLELRREGAGGLRQTSAIMGKEQGKLVRGPLYRLQGRF